MRRGVNGRAKGSAGEREFCHWLQDTFKLDALPERNLDQTRDGGADVLDMFPFVYEVKRVERLDLDTWWLQVLKAARELGEDRIPVVAFRQNNQQWEFLISAKNIGIQHGYVRAKALRFQQWVEMQT